MSSLSIVLMRPGGIIEMDEISIEFKLSALTLVTVLDFIISVFTQYSLFLIFMIFPLSWVPSVRLKTLDPYWSMIYFPGEWSAKTDLYEFGYDDELLGLLEIWKLSAIKFHIFFNQLPINSWNDLFSLCIEKSWICHASGSGGSANLRITLD